MARCQWERQRGKNKRIDKRKPYVILRSRLEFVDDCYLCLSLVFALDLPSPEDTTASSR